VEIETQIERLKAVASEHGFVPVARFDGQGDEVELMGLEIRRFEDTDYLALHFGHLGTDRKEVYLVLDEAKFVAAIQSLHDE